MKVLVRAAIVVTLFAHPSTYASTRARILAETVLDDPPARVVVAGFHACRVNEGGTASCWGDNQQGQLGDGTLTSRSTPALVSGLRNVVALASGQGHTCALLGGGRVRCWGDNLDGQLGDGSTTDRLTPVTVSGLTRAVAITAAASHTCALLGDGTVRCWGDNSDGELGDGTTVDRPFPTPVPGLSRAVAIATGTSHTCAIVGDGSVRCWGLNSSRQLGDGTTTQRLSPMLVTDVVAAVGIAAGFDHTCAVIGNGTVACWGSNAVGQLGDGTTTTRFTAVLVNGLPTQVVDVDSTGNHTCARLADGTVRCWGINEAGQLGDGTTTSPQLIPVPVNGIGNAVAVAAGSAQTCALLADGSMSCWGSNELGGLGDGTFLNSLVPMPVLGGGGTKTARDVAAAGNHTCAVRASGAVACWGDNTNGQLGDGTTVNQLTPVAVGGLSDAVAVAAGELHTCAVLADGTVRCWGENSGGQLGDGTTTQQLAPVPVSGLSNVVGIAAGDMHTCAVLGNGGVRCWGDNATGQLGDGTTNGSLVPIVVTIPAIGRAANGAAIAIGAGAEHTCVRLADGTVRCWGGGGQGQLGDGSIDDRLSPVGGNGLTDVVGIAAGEFHTCSLRANPISVSGAAPSVAFCWGANSSGSLGDGTTAQRTTPVPVVRLASGVALAAGGAHTCAVLATGRMRCWGDNDAGQIGDGTTTQRLVPTKVATVATPLANVVQVATGDSHTCALVSNGGVRCWGEGSFGQIGTGSTANVLRPAVVPSFLLNRNRGSR
jgi:alpha-tubulin suppressor-like RCC1 family protein